MATSEPGGPAKKAATKKAATKKAPAKKAPAKKAPAKKAPTPPPPPPPHPPPPPPPPPPPRPEDPLQAAALGVIHAMKDLLDAAEALVGDPSRSPSAWLGPVVEQLLGAARGARSPERKGPKPFDDVPLRGGRAGEDEV